MAKGDKQGYELLAYYDATAMGRKSSLYPMTQCYIPAERNPHQHR